MFRLVKRDTFRVILSGLICSCLLLISHSSQAASEEAGAKKGDLILLPFAYYTPETSTAIVLTGIYTRRPDEQNAKPSSLMAFVTYTAENQRAISIIPELYTRSKLKITGRIGTMDFPDKFYGIGLEVTDDDEEDYVQVASNLSMAVQLEVFSGLLAGVKYDYEDLKVEDVESGGLLDTGSVTGSKGGDVSGLGFLLTYDSRDDLFFPSRGYYTEAAAMSYGEGIGSDFKYDTYILDCRQFISPGSIIIGFQEYLHFSSGNPPFHRLAQLGGTDLMRGYFMGKFRDRNMAAAQVETRISLSQKFGLVLFGSAGSVASKPGDLGEGSLLTAFGTGLRYRVGKQEPINLRLDLALGEDGESGIYFTVREAF